MPTYACDECGEAFRSKQALRDHVEEHDGSGGGVNVVPAVRSVWRTVSGFNRKQLLILFAVFLMSTLFLGTAFYASLFAPAGGGGGAGQQGRYVNPLTGYSRDQVPQPSALSLPQGYVAAEQLGEDEQLYILVAGSTDGGPAILLQYSCSDCPDTVNLLQQVASRFQGYVYVAPYREMEQRVAATALGNIQTYDTVDAETLERFVCESFQRYPVRFRPLGCGVLAGDDAGSDAGVAGGDQ